MLNNISSVDEVDVFGDRPRRIEVQLDPLSIQHAGLRIDGVAGSVRNSLADSGAGQVAMPMDGLRIRTESKPRTANEIAAIPIHTRSGVLPLSELATVVELLEKENVRVKHQGEKAWYINLYKRKNSNISALSELVGHRLQEINQEFFRCRAALQG